jgi:uncharacterized protein RhaS with RHS repeats
LAPNGFNPSASLAGPRARRDRSTVNRYYDPTTGQFLKVDPLVDQTEQPYAYVAGDPVDNVDLNGECWTGLCWAAHAWNAVVQARRHLLNWEESHPTILSALQVAGLVADDSGDVDVPSVTRTSGETSATALGRYVHSLAADNPKSFYGPGNWRPNVTIRNTEGNVVGYADAVDPTTHVVAELKPANARALARGEVQGRRYAENLTETTGVQWTYRVVGYKSEDFAPMYDQLQTQAN